MKCLEGFADINALYWHDEIDDGSSCSLGTKKDSSLNMNGTGEDWDGGLKLSSTGPRYRRNNEKHLPHSRRDLCI